MLLAVLAGLTVLVDVSAFLVAGRNAISNTVIGMLMPAIGEKYYSEYVVTAGIPIDIYSCGGGWSHPNAIGVSMYSSVFGDAITAVLEAGKDYETLYRHPSAILRELVVVNGVVRTKPVAVKKYKDAKTLTWTGLRFRSEGTRKAFQKSLAASQRARPHASRLGGPS
nr:hypothetical protein [uncultured Achromobacter sp.]